MAVDAKAVLERVSVLLMDADRVRWPLAELLSWFNDAMREITLIRPSATAVSVAFQLVSGTRQTIPTDCVSLLEVTRNMLAGSPLTAGRAIRMVDKDALNQADPSWHDGRSVRFRKEVKNAVFDPADPTSFFVYPGNDGTGYVEAIVSKVPASITTLAVSGATNASIPATYANAIIDYVLYRAYSKEGAFVGSANRAAAHYGQFRDAVAGSIRTSAINPNTQAPLEQGGAV